jgi:cystathionine gamma-lyase
MTVKPSLGTLCINAGSPPAQQGKAFRNGPEFASTYHLSGEVDHNVHQYGRFSQPSWDALEQGFSELEGGDTVIFPSGMSAAAAVLTSLVEPGDTILLPSDGYAPVRYYVEKYLVKFGIQLKTIATKDLDDYDFKGVALALLETPSNPMLDVFDIRLASEKIHHCDGLLAIDNTTLTLLGQQPLALGADISLSADTKAVNGHSDVLFGHVSSKDRQISDKIREWRKFSGNIPGPMETWLVHRSLATLDMRLERMCKNAQQLACVLQLHPKVLSIRYPGLETDLSHNMAKKQQHLFGFIISFELADKNTAYKFLDKCNLVYQATSFGGVHSMAERRARWGTDDIPEGVIRFSVGCERAQDILADVIAALDSI